MNIEYEATFTNIQKESVRNKLKELGAVLVKPELLQKRSVFHLPPGQEVKGGWARVRDEGDKITMSIKIVDGDKIQNQRESCLIINDFAEAEQLLETLGCRKKAYQESLRELWMIDSVEVTIDTWPFLDTFVEVEGKTEEAVKAVSEGLGFVWTEAKFCAVDKLYAEKYGISESVINDHTPFITFDMQNPFLVK